jgi:hypothetical protein
VRLISFAALVLVLAVSAFACSSSDSSTSGLPPAASPGAAQATPPRGPVAYDVIDRWTMPNGDPGESIVIPDSYLNEEGAGLLGAQLQADTATATKAVIFIYTDKRAAALRLNLNDANADDQAFYAKHYAGQYTRSTNSGYHKLEMCFDGVACTKGRTIDY